MRKHCCKRFYEYLEYSFDRLVPLESDTRKIGLRYDKSIESFYVFFRYIVAISILTFMIFLTMQVIYIYNSWGNRNSLCINFIPCMILYSRFPNGKELYYLFTIIGFILIVFICNMYKWMVFHKLMKWDEIHGDHEKPLSKLFFNAWDWSIDTRPEYIEKQKATVRQLQLTQDEAKIKVKIKNRSQKEKI